MLNILSWYSAQTSRAFDGDIHPLWLILTLLLMALCCLLAPFAIKGACYFVLLASHLLKGTPLPEVTFDTFSHF